MSKRRELEERLVTIVAQAQRSTTNLDWLKRENAPITNTEFANACLELQSLYMDSFFDKLEEDTTVISIDALQVFLTNRDILNNLLNIDENSDQVKDIMRGWPEFKSFKQMIRGHIQANEHTFNLIIEMGLKKIKSQSK